ncbi:MAG: hypothetical protein HYR51_01460 [Candidatus Rokubacteria bacterium]|nr:hypothetical protein [Candidatus Rokubacteria bacterium]
MRRIATAVTGLVLLAVTSVAAQQAYTGTVLRIDPAAGVIVFQDGRMFQTTADTVIISNNQRTMLHSLNQGSQVTVYSAQPVALRDGRYVLMSETGARAATSSTVIVPPPPAGAVVTTPGTTTVVTQPAREEWTMPAFEVSGHIFRADHMGRVIHMRDGRKVHVTEDTQVLLNGTQPVQLSTLAPDSYVVVRSVRPFAGSRSELVPMSEVARGTVVRVDQPGVIVLNDGRAFRTSQDTVVYVDRRPVTVSTLHPGTRVVVYQDGSTLAVVSDPAASPALVPEAGLQQKENDRQGGGN